MEERSRNNHYDLLSGSCVELISKESKDQRFTEAGGQLNQSGVILRMEEQTHDHKLFRLQLLINSVSYLL